MQRTSAGLIVAVSVALARGVAAADFLPDAAALIAQARSAAASMPPVASKAEPAPQPQLRVAAATVMGIVQWIIADEGYGSIRTDAGELVRVLVGDIAGYDSSLSWVGRRVTFRILRAPGDAKAVEVRPLPPATAR